MKKYSVMIVSAALLVSSCTTGAGAGAYAGSSLGSILGSAIGGIVGGPHGSDIGTIVGMASGAAVGGAIGAAADQQQRDEQHEVLARRNQRIQREKAQSQQGQQYGSQQQYNSAQPYGSGVPSYGNGAPSYGSDDVQQYGSDSNTIDPSQMVDNSNSGDDRIDFSTTDASHLESITPAAAAAGKLTVKNVRFNDVSGDGKLTAGETATVTFEMYNNTQSPIYNFDPSVVEADGNKRIYISPSVRVENIMPGQGLRYTATVKADSRIKEGQIRLLVSAQKDGKPISYVTVVKVNVVRP